MPTWSPLELELPIARSPDAVRSWWTDLPEDYVATDPAEQPHRIRTLERYPDGRLLETHWRIPFGVMRSRERLTLHEDGTWSYATDAPFGLGALDEFEATPAGEGTRLRIRATLAPRRPIHRALGFVLAPMVKGMFRRTFTTAARLCEEGAAPAASGEDAVPASANV